MKLGDLVGPPLGVKKSLAKLAPNDDGSELVGKLVLGAVNFLPRQTGKHQSEVPIGGKMYGSPFSRFEPQEIEPKRAKGPLPNRELKRERTRVAAEEGQIHSPGHRAVGNRFSFCLE